MKHYVLGVAFGLILTATVLTGMAIWHAPWNYSERLAAEASVCIVLAVLSALIAL